MRYRSFLICISNNEMKFVGVTDTEEEKRCIVSKDLHKRFSDLKKCKKNFDMFSA